LTYAH
jgi:hypothetical protein